MPIRQAQRSGLPRKVCLEGQRLRERYTVVSKQPSGNVTVVLTASVNITA
ncbi:hypothetical protein M2334_000450 [Sphingobium sp. B11D3D]|nr:hypothetical protein [Sphingobium sp. B12D2B]MCW2368251.1 hypothetical protein [Sphingobium sp. B11D3D]